MSCWPDNSKARGKSLLERAQQAMGGAAKLAAVKDSTQILELALDPSAGGMKMNEWSGWG